ncbi:hypothetical protein OZ382_003520 [Vibrio cholerae]|nr:hypothetical protein [Vibrio cholerae]
MALDVCLLDAFFIKCLSRKSG